MNDTTTPTPRNLSGYIDRVTNDGIVEGWGWDENQPGLRLNLTILVDNEPVGTTTAMLYRGDLAHAGIDDGHHGFKFPLPYEALGKKRELRISVRETNTGVTLGKPFLLFRNDVVTIDDRVAELEGTLKLLQSRLAELLSQSTQQNNAASAALFQTIGSFFMQLAAEAETGVSGQGPLGTLLNTIGASYDIITLPRSETPVATICVEADAPFAEVYKCLQALLSNGICEKADVVLLDPGAQEDIALLPTIIRGLRYLRVQGELLAERNTVAAESRTELVAFLSAHALPERGWLDEICAPFTASINIAAVGSKVARSDGTVEHAGLILRDTERFTDIGVGRIDGDPTCNHVCKVAALGSYAVAFRRAAFIAAGGFDVALIEPAAATLDLCLRFGQHQESVIYQPFARVLWRESAKMRSHWVTEDLASRPGFYDLLKQRWTKHLSDQATARRDTPRQIGRALVLSGGPDCVATAKRLVEQGYDVTYGHIFDSHENEGYRIVAREGIRALSVPFYTSLEGYLRQEGETIDLIHASKAESNKLSGLDGLFPNAKIVHGIEAAATSGD
ncbi:glycosyltransferase family A protein [Acidocella aminolytica]|uniref:Uncharacterized protein n=1 Tax=Acidocella aminolytica 101 = DSM 11237 TaxID=1120923 RepID=A0A0D6PKA8_9PROT|nr:glycosyltransferase family A protein [Acidocella aminolytica]GAN81623.1 hypothetical protein Aam_107_001 [Acidocella aminolytica 101 = DSM 11237]GBQ40353.1 hypothetical protein AA11237_2336 [Acidocella aminolytica 101 = DSM 11237]SHF58191.1 hypothetical protein SAMN02746095_03771 [Acidocella aminolytica 101 = DSM 11237]